MYKLSIINVITTLLIMIASKTLHAQNENQNLFNLAENPFINDGKYSIFLSYGFNQGPPSLIIDEWQLPDDSKNILFNEYKAGFSIGGKFSFIYKKIIGNKLEFNSSHIGINTTPTINHFGLKVKIYEDESYYPDYTLGWNSQELLAIDFMVGSMRERFKYYAYTAIGFFYFIPYPYNFTAGISYEFINDFDLFAEVRPFGDPDDQYNSILLGISYTAYEYFLCQLSLYYFDFKFKESIPFRDGLTWQDPLHIMNVPEKDQYYLISFRLSLALNKKIFHL
jgi:hypothetical protein